VRGSSSACVRAVCSGRKSTSVKLVTVEQMRAAEQAAAEAGMPERDLMENAGLAAAQEAWMAVGAMEGRGIVILAGPGNNGGDGLVAARHLAEWGASVAVYLLRPRAEDDEVWRATLEAAVPHLIASEDEDFAGLEEWLGQSTCVVDALLGTGVARPIAGDLAEVLARLRTVRAGAMRPQLIALDLPTGVDPDTGYADPATVPADLTIAFGFPKVGLYSMPARSIVGRVMPVDIGLPPTIGLPYEEVGFRETQSAMPARPLDAHKGTFGRAVVAAGSRRYPGAARLAAEAAARSGAGLVVIAAPEIVQPIVAQGLPDAVHEPLPSTEGALDGEAARVLLRALDGATSLLVGPGLSHTRHTEEFVRSLLAGLETAPGASQLRGLVLDADALNVLAVTPGWHERLTLPHVLTPHPGEMSRLTGRSSAEVQSNRLRSAVEYAVTTSSVVVLKGACTVVASPDGRARISAAANPMLATAGTGDVLAGLIAGLIAQGVEPFDAASAGVYLHADAGRLVTEEHGTASGLAQDLLPKLAETRKLLDGG